MLLNINKNSKEELIVDSGNVLSSDLYKNELTYLENLNKTLGSLALETGSGKDYNPPRTQGKEATENMSEYTNVMVFEPEQASRFPNLLEDKDFAFYYWTLPICNL